MEFYKMMAKYFSFLFVLVFFIYSNKCLSQSVNTKAFTVIGQQRDGITCPPKVFYPECQRSSKDDALVKARAHCYPDFIKQSSPWEVIDNKTISAHFICTELSPETESGPGQMIKICEIDSTPGQACNRNHGVCLKCRYEVKRP